MNRSRVMRNHVAWLHQCSIGTGMIIISKVNDGLGKTKNMTATMRANTAKVTSPGISQAAVLFICAVNGKPKGYRFIRLKTEVESVLMWRGRLT